ncbi:unnamed protein product [Sphenostylis stenocarpa]|uniref:Uncharacterized protein n=1 Tax=Sphenostylis stenocarpa TaxID=92480 RepID=A0AA87BAX5_9FABA|nr:unnamed protein product [Sphenostylis stenocarpa]
MQKIMEKGVGGSQELGHLRSYSSTSSSLSSQRLYPSHENQLEGMKQRYGSRWVVSCCEMPRMGDGVELWKL